MVAGYYEEANKQRKKNMISILGNKDATKSKLVI